MAYKYQTFADLLCGSNSRLRFRFGTLNEKRTVYVMSALSDLKCLRFQNGTSSLNNLKVHTLCEQLPHFWRLWTGASRSTGFTLYFGFAIEIRHYPESRFGKGSTVSSQLTGFCVKALPGKGHTVCGLLVDDPTLASMRKARHSLTFLYGVDADAIEAATIWPRDPRKDIRRISNLINVVTEMGTEKSNDI